MESPSPPPPPPVAAAAGSSGPPRTAGEGQHRRSRTGDPVALADAVQRVVEDPELPARLATASLEKSAMSDVTGAPRRIEGVYREITGS